MSLAVSKGLIKPLKSGVYKAKDTQKDVLQAVTPVSTEKHPKYSEWLHSCSSCTISPYIYLERRNTSLGYVNLGLFKNVIMFKNNFIALWLDLVWLETNELPIKSAVRALNTDVLRLMYSLELRQTVKEDEDEDGNLRQSNQPWLVKQDISWKGSQCDHQLKY